MEKSKIGITGINTNASDVYSPEDGSCLYIENMKPTGVESNPKWRMIGDKSPVPFNLSWSSDDILEIKSFYYYSGAWFVAVKRYIHPTDSVDYFRVYKCNYSGGAWQFGTLLLEQEYNDFIAEVPRITWKEIKGDLFMHISPRSDSEFPYLFKLNADQDAFIPHVIPPMIYPIEVSLSYIQITNEIFQEKYYYAGANQYPGFITNSDKYIGIIYALKLSDGVYIKHSQPRIVRIPKQVTNTTTDVQLATLEFTYDDEYVNNPANYRANVALFDDYQFPYQVSGQTITDTFDHHNYDNVANGEKSYEVCIFCTRARSSYEKALNDGGYYLIGSAGQVGSFATDKYQFKDNEETIVLNPQLNIDPFSHHVTLPKYLGEFRNNIVTCQTITNFALPGWEWQRAGNKNFINSTPSVGVLNEECAVRVTIKVGDKTFYRINKIPLNQLTSILYMPFNLSYPDRRARYIELFWYDSSNGKHKRVLNEQLFEHSSLNISYNYENSRSSVTTPSDGDGDTTLDWTVNDEYLIEENKVRISDLTLLNFPLERTYEMSDPIMGVIDNIDEVGSGQFGDYPVYFLGRNKIFGGKSSGDSFISKVDLICSTHGVLGPDAFTIYKNGLWFASDYGLHVMKGAAIQDIFRTVEDAVEYDIRFNYFGQDVALQETSASGITEMLSSIRVQVECSAEGDEILFTQPQGFWLGIWVYNIRYNKWYVYNPRTIDYFRATVSIHKIGNQIYFLDSNGGLDESAPYFNNNCIRNWQSEEGVGSFKLITNPIVLNDYSVFKNIKTSVLQGVFSLSDDSELDVILQGKRSTHEDWVNLLRYTEDTEKDFNSFYLKSNYGPFQAYRILIKGTDIKSGTQLGNILIEYRNRSKTFKK